MSVPRMAWHMVRRGALRAWSSTSGRYLSSTTPLRDGLTEEQVRRIGEEYERYRKDHLELKTDVPATSLDPSNANVDKDLLRRKRLIYRSKQRGWLEVDMLLGTWASENVMQLSKEEMDEYEKILNQETIDIFNYINGKDQPPAEIQNSMLKRLQEYAMSSPFGKASVEKYAEMKERAGLT